MGGLIRGVGSWLSSNAMPLIGGLFSAKGARDRNRVQRQMAREQMAFQERMSSTAFQRSAKDLKAAGLNRILALGKPASSPGGAMAPIMDELTPAVSSALQAKRLSEDVKNLRMQRHLLDAQTSKTANEVASTWVDKNLKLQTWEAFDKHPWAKEAAMLSQTVGPQIGTAFGISKLFSEGQVRDFLKNLWFGGK